MIRLQRRRPFSIFLLSALLPALAWAQEEVLTQQAIIPPLVSMRPGGDTKAAERFRHARLPIIPASSDPTNAAFLELIQTQPYLFQGRALDLGTGRKASLALAMIDAGAVEVVAMDIYARAIRRARDFAWRRGIRDRLILGCSNLYDRLPKITKEIAPVFDVIVFNHPIRRGLQLSGDPMSMIINAGRGFEVIRNALAGIPSHLNPRGSAYFWVLGDMERTGEYWSLTDLQADLMKGWEAQVVLENRFSGISIVRIFRTPALRTSA